MCYHECNIIIRLYESELKMIVKPATSKFQKRSQQKKSSQLPSKTVKKVVRKPVAKKIAKRKTLSKKTIAPVHKKIAGAFVAVAIVVTAGIAILDVINSSVSNAQSAKGAITGVASKCLDNNGARVVNRNKVQLFTCNGSAAQAWTLPGDGTIRVQGYCLDVPGGNRAPKTYVQIYTCNGTHAQKWTTNSDGTIVNTRSGLCLDDQYRKAGDGNPIWMYQCNQTIAQKWTLPSVSAAPTPKPIPAPAPTPTQSTGVCQVLPQNPSAITTARSSKKKVFAYYFPPFPVSTDNKAGSADSYSQWLYSHNSRNGAYDLRDRPFARNPWSRSDWKQADFEVEIRRAIEVGIDGFVWEYHTSSDQRWNQLPAMLAAARAVDPGFKIQLSPDFQAEAGASPDSVVNDVLKVKDDPNIFRLDDGRIVLSPFYPERQPVSFWDSLTSKLAAKGVKIALVPMFLSWSGNSTEKAEWKGHVYGYSQWGTRSTTGIATLNKNAAEAHSRGGVWMQPVAFEDSRSYDGRFWESSNSSLLRQSLESAINNNADWIVLTTWNDYTESWISPSQKRGYAPTDVASYYFDWFKSGKVPTVARDAIYWFHRSQRTDAPFSNTVVGRNGSGLAMYVPNGNPASNDVEMVAFLTSPAKLTIKQGGVVKTMDAGAGVVSFKVPMIGGTTPIFTLERGGKMVKSTTSNTPIQSTVAYQDMIYHAGGGIEGCKRP
jgi:hypothetical protein